MSELYENGPVGVPPERRRKPHMIWYIMAAVLSLAGLAMISVQQSKAELDERTGAACAVTVESLPNNSFYEASRVFGKAGCGDVNLAQTVARYSEQNGVSPNLLAAVIAVESHCDPLAVSPKGAVGIMQVMPKVWNEAFDFRQTNLLDPTENIQVGSKILGELIRYNSPRTALSKYNGTGAAANAYAEKVLALAK